MKKIINNISPILLWFAITFIFGCLFFYTDEVSEENKEIIATVEGHIDDYTTAKNSKGGYYISKVIYTYTYNNEKYTQQGKISNLLSSTYSDKIINNKLTNIDVYIIKTKADGNIYATIEKPVILSRETVLLSKIIFIIILLVIMANNIRKLYKTNNICDENNNYNDCEDDDEEEDDDNKILPENERKKINEIIEKLNKDKNKLRYSTESLDYSQNMDIASDIDNIIEVVKKLQNYIDNYDI